MLATRQKCISKGLITLEEVNKINEYLCELLEFKFDRMYVQPDGDDKTETFKQIIQDYGHPLILFDDSEKECITATALGIETVLTSNLMESIIND